MQQWIMVVVLWAHATASRYYLYPNYREHSVTTKSPNWEENSVNTNEVVEDASTGIKYNPYSKHHPGRHVCSGHRDVSDILENSKQTCCKPNYQRYMVRCGNQWCSGVRLVYEQYNKQVVASNGQRSDVTYYCCPGWTQVTNRSYGCNKPICPQPCYNGGVCAQPGICNCPSGYGGAYCETRTRYYSLSEIPMVDITKFNTLYICDSSKTCVSSPCQNGGTCKTDGTCLCAAGYQGNQCEEDIDECKSKVCQQICRNTPGSYDCDCKENFQLQTDQESCEPESGDDNTATEARDMRYDKLENRLQRLEKMMKEGAENQVTKKDINLLHENMAIIAKNVKAMKTQLCKIEDIHSDLEDMKHKMLVLEDKTQKIEEASLLKPKIPQSIVKICTNHSSG